MRKFSVMYSTRTEDRSFRATGLCIGGAEIACVTELSVDGNMPVIGPPCTSNLEIEETLEPGTCLLIENDLSAHIDSTILG